MPDPYAKGVTRHLTYAWIEFGHSGDGQAFSEGLDKLGWKNLVRLLPRKKDRKGSLYVDSAHPLLPVRWKGRARMILPNAVKDTEDWPPPYIQDPLFDDYRAAHGDTAFEAEMGKTCEFLARWVFCPGVKGDPTSGAALTHGADATDHADLVACSGHGCGGTVWGGSASLGCQLDEALSAHGASTSSPRLKYVLIPTCYNLSDEAHRLWIPALHRSNPVHGVFGYSKAYPGGQTGRGIFTRFAENLRKDGGRMPILEAFQKAHTGYLTKRWGAVIHQSSMNDCMRDWLAGKLPTPSPTGELRWFCDDTWPSGAVVRTEPPPYQVSYVVGGTKITRSNRNWSSVGLFPGATGHLEIRKAAGTIDPAETLQVVFHYYRPEKDGMDLEKLLQIGTSPDATVSLGRDLNKRDGTGHVDGLEVRAARPGLSAIEIPFTVHPEVRSNYHGDAYFWTKLVAGASTDCAFYFEGAWLRGPIP